MIDIVKSIAEQWNRSLVNYAVANGLQDYPRRLGRDIDVVVERRHLLRASVIVRSVLEEHGWSVVVRRSPELVQHIALTPGPGGFLIIDLFPGLRWGPVWLVEQPAASQRLDEFCVDPWVSFVKRVLLHVLVAPGRKFADRPELLQLTDAEHAAASTRLAALVGAALAVRLVETVQQQDVEGLEALRPQLRKALILSSVREAPLRALRTGVQWATARVRFATAGPVMPTLGIVGPDDVDRAAVLAEVVRQARERLHCPRSEVRHGRPGILPPHPNYPATGSHSTGAPTAPTLRRPSALRTAYFGLDYFLGRLLLDRRVSMDLGLVVYERSAIDLYVEHLHSGGQPGWMLRLVRCTLPPPDLLVLLYDEPTRTRWKSGSDEAAIQQQRDVWMQLADNGSVHMVIKTNSNPRVPAELIVNRLVELFVRRNSVREATASKIEGAEPL